MLVDLKRMVAYICPFCSNISSKNISVFHFSGADKLSLKCPTHGCGETCATIAQKGAKYRLSVACPLCGATHSFASSADSFWHKKLLTYKCGAAGIDIFFAGEKREVEKTLEDYSDIYSDIIDEFDEDIDDIGSFSLLYEILDRLHLLKETNRLSCTCGSETVDMNVINGNVMLTCPRCKRSKVLETNEETLTRLLNSSAVIIGS